MCVIRTGKEGETGLIEIQNVSYAYEDAAAKALNNVSLTINDGEFVAVVGHNGSGKSTLAKHLNALLLPTEGKVLVDGMDTADEADTLSIRQRVGMVFQNPDNQLVTTIVEEDVAFGPENIGVPGNEIRTRVDRALAAVGMEKYAHSAPNMLSGGQKQRIAIAGMLAMQPKVLVLDEATAMLDPKGRRDIIDLVTKLHKENGITVVMITQYMEEAIGADRVAVMSGRTDTLKAHPKRCSVRMSFFISTGAGRARDAAACKQAECARCKPAEKYTQRGGNGASNMPIVVEKLNYAYMQGSAITKAALTDISLRIEDGEFLGLIGHTGSGKSTFVQQLNGLLQPNSGTVHVDGFDMADKKQRMEGRKLVGMVFQYPEYQLFEESVERDVAFGVKNMGIGEEEALERAHEAMALVGLAPEKFAAKSPFELSGGEKRRAALAGIIAMKPKYLVLDEPMAGLDPLGRKAILDTIDNLRASLGCAVLMVSHSMDDMADRAERVAVMNGGRLVMEGKTRDVFAQSELLTSIGLDVPQASKLGMELRKRGIDIPENIYEIEEMELALLKLLSKGGRA